MKRVCGILFFVLFFFTAWSQGWRKGEMEVMVKAGNSSGFEILRNLGLDFEPAGNDRGSIRMYLIPDELKLLQDQHLSYRVTIPDMNRHFENFWDNPMVPTGYYTYDQIISIADSLATNFPAICTKVIWGTSLGGRQLAALKISDNVNTDEPEPEIMFDGGIHGDEIGGSQNIIMFARDLCLGYGSNSTITTLVNTREIWLYLMVNPDGRVAMSRYNNNMVDCNRDCGYMWNAEGNSPGAFSQVETKSWRNCLLDNQFTVFTNYHSGTEILAYPWSYRSDPARDMVNLNYLAGVYSNTSGYPNLQYGQGYNIMYPINGSTKDVQYGMLGNIGWSIEISVNKQPPASQIMYYYNANKPAMLALINECGWGVSGMVTDSVTGEPVRAIVQVNNLFPVITDPVVGDYHKFLVPGFYSLKVMANGYQTKTVTNIAVPSQGTGVTNIQLVPSTGFYAYKVLSCRIPGNNFGDEGYTPGALGPPNGVPYALGKNGWIILDMGDTIYNGPGDDFKIIESGTASKPFTVSGGNNLDGPFTTIGVGTGTTSFDLGTTSLTKVRYLYIKDNGVGPAYGVGAGFNLDVVEMLTPPLIVRFTANNTSLCTGNTVNFTDNSSGNPVSWQWSFPGGTPSTSTDQNPQSIQYDNPGTYNVSLTVSNGITSGSKTRTGYITVNGTPVVSLGNDTILCGWNSMVLDAGNPGGTYLWSTGATSQSIVADTAGAGYGPRIYWVTVMNDFGCVSGDTLTITFDDCTGISETGQHPGIFISPNPSDKQFILDINGFEGGNWQLLSLTGSLTKHAIIDQAYYKTIIDVRELPGGLYFLKVQKSDSVMVKKILVSHIPGK